VARILPARAASALALLLLTGCAVPPRSSAGPFAGRWVSTFSSEFVRLELRQSGSRVTGRAELAPRGARAEYAVEGTVRESGFAATLRRGEGGEVALRAALRGDTLDVRLDGGGYSDRFVPLVRE